jgi:hypothetical protein
LLNPCSRTAAHFVISFSLSFFFFIFCDSLIRFCCASIVSIRLYTRYHHLYVDIILDDLFIRRLVNDFWNILLSISCLLESLGFVELVSASERDCVGAMDAPKIVWKTKKHT